MTEPEVIRTLRQDVRDGNVFLHDEHNEIVCATAVILQAYDTLRAERDALRKALLRCDRTCETVMHRELERHGIGERCPVVGLIDAALAVQPSTGDTP